jgi:hypothetical protein
MSYAAPLFRNRVGNRRLGGRFFEQLERRDMLSGNAPKVVDIEVAGTSWSSAFVGYLQSHGLGTNGYSVPQGSSAQSASLTWTNIDQIILTFDKDVIVKAADLSISGINSTTYGFSSFHYDPQTYVATWTLNTAIYKDRLRLDLDANGADPVRDLAGNVLDGEWTNNSSTASGNGTAGGDFQFNFNVLPTDVNTSASITSYDYVYIRQLDGKATSSTGYLATRDVDGSGLIDSTDWQEALNRASQVLPGGSAAGTYNDAPTTSSLSRVEITDAAVDVAISLLSGFGDLENGSSGLTYSIVSNSDASLFDSLAINQSTKELVVNAASNVSGRSNIVIRATDANGLTVDTTVTVDVDRENIAPEIQNYLVCLLGANTWLISGDVVDGDDNVANFIVQFSGVVETRSAVDENGHFEFAVILPQGAWGSEQAVTYDPHGGMSNVPVSDIGIT